MGGMEAHSWHLVRALFERGHDVTMFASGDSDPGDGPTLRPVIARHYEADLPWARHRGTARLERHLRAAYGRAGEMLGEGRFDVVHNNALSPHALEAVWMAGLPCVTSLHVPPFDALREAMARTASRSFRWTVTSRVQARSWWGEGGNPHGAVVHNGIDLTRWSARSDRPRRPRHAVWAGRITPNKGTHLALEAARLAGVSLDLYGSIEDEGYFEERVRPHLTAAIRYRGHGAAADLAAAFARASVLLFTPLWNEPFGLVAAEALAAGVPVAATDFGAAREVIGDAGVIAREATGESLALALRQALRIDGACARRRAERCFSIEAMVERYEAQYRLAMQAGRDAGSDRPAPHGVDRSARAR